MTVGRVRRRISWFLPENPDVLGMLRRQGQVTIEGMDALTSWASGDEAAADRLREKEHEADDVKRALRVALRISFITPIGAEDIYVLSERLDAVLNGAKDAVRESEVMALAPDEHVEGMVGFILEGVRHLDDAFRLLRPDSGEEGSKTDAADAAIKSQRQLERVYRRAMSALLDVDDLREVIGRRELYRRFSRVGDHVIEAAERVWYSTLKEG